MDHVLQEGFVMMGVFIVVHSPLCNYTLFKIGLFFSFSFFFFYIWHVFENLN